MAKRGKKYNASRARVSRDTRFGDIGEADAFELRRVLDEAKGDAELREQWHRLHLIRDAVRATGCTIPNGG